MINNFKKLPMINNSSKETTTNNLKQLPTINKETKIDNNLKE